MIETFAALGEPSRLRIVELLREGPRPVGAIGAALRLSQPQVSKHLRVLRAARLVEVEPRAQQRLYGLRAKPLRDLNRWLEQSRGLWDERMNQLEEVVTEMTAASKKKENRHARRPPSK